MGLARLLQELMADGSCAPATVSVHLTFVAYARELVCGIRGPAVAPQPAVTYSQQELLEVVAK